MTWIKQWGQKEFNRVQVDDTIEMLNHSEWLSNVELNLLFSVENDFCEYYVSKKCVLELSKYGDSIYSEEEFLPWIKGTLESAVTLSPILELYFLTEDLITPSDLVEVSIAKSYLDCINWKTIKKFGYTVKKPTKITNIDFIRYARLTARFIWMEHYPPSTDGFTGDFNILKQKDKYCIKRVTKHKQLAVAKTEKLVGKSINKLLGVDEGIAAFPGDEFIRGRILVVPNCKPELIEHFSDIRAFVSDEGGLVSHAVQIAREMGLPCIVGTKNATKMIKSGDTIRMHYDTGEVEII